MCRSSKHAGVLHAWQFPHRITKEDSKTEKQNQNQTETNKQKKSRNKKKSQTNKMKDQAFISWTIAPLFMSHCYYPLMQLLI